MEELGNKKRVRDEPDESDSDDVKRLKLELFDEFEVVDTVDDLDSFMKSFEEEILNSSSSSAAVVEAESELVDLTSDSGDSQPELGFLLEASDDELGLPPSTVPDEVAKHDVLVRAGSDASESNGGNIWGFEEQVSGYDDAFGYGPGAVEPGEFVGENFTTNNSEYVALDGLFDYSDMGFGSDGFYWRSETLPAQ